MNSPKKMKIKKLNECTHSEDTVNSLMSRKKKRIKKEKYSIYVYTYIYINCSFVSFFFYFCMFRWITVQNQPKPNKQIKRFFFEMY